MTSYVACGCNSNSEWVESVTPDKRVDASFVKRVQSSASRYTGRRSMQQTSRSCALSRGRRASFRSWMFILEIRSGSRCNFSDVYWISWICCQLMNAGTKYVFLFFLCHSTQVFLLLASLVLHRRDGRCAARRCTSSMLRLAQKSHLLH